MYDKSHVRFVDSHSECYRGHDYVNVLHQEPVLVLCPGLGIESGMVRGCLYSVDVQQLCQFLHFFSAEAVDDSGLARILPYIFDYIPFGV